MTRPKKNIPDDPDRVQRVTKWASNNRLTAAALLLVTVVGGVASFGDNLSKATRSLQDAVAWLRAPSAPTLKGNFLFADDRGLHYFLKNEGRAPAFVTGADIEFKTFKITEKILKDSKLDPPSPGDVIGQWMPSFRASLRKVTMETQIAPMSSSEYVFAIPQGPYSWKDAALVALGGSCNVSISWKPSDGDLHQLSLSQPCKDFSPAFHELVSHD